MNEMLAYFGSWLGLLLIALIYALCIFALWCACAWVAIKLYFIHKLRYDKAREGKDVSTR